MKCEDGPTRYYPLLQSMEVQFNLHQVPMVVADPTGARWHCKSSRHISKVVDARQLTLVQTNIITFWTQGRHAANRQTCPYTVYRVNVGGLGGLPPTEGGAGGMHPARVHCLHLHTHPHTIHLSQSTIK